MNRVAIIDCGTNTFNLLIAEPGADKRTYKKVLSSRIPVKLGQNGINKGIIASEAYSRGMAALEAFSERISECEVTAVQAFATSAIRDAENGRAFIQEAFDKFGIVIKVIDGDEEARLIYEGNRRAVQLVEKCSLIMDIGGGSTEFILCNAETVFWKQSFQLGAARLLDLFKPSDPVTEEEENTITAFLKQQLQPLSEAIGKNGTPVDLIGSSGAFDSIIEIIHYAFGGEALRSEKTEYSIAMSHYRAVATQIINSTTEERRNIKGLIEMRVDMMVISSLLINAVLDFYSIEQLKASTYSLKEGALFLFMEEAC